MIPLDDLEVYKVSMYIGEMIWTIITRWPSFEKETLGKQIVRAADSIALNISEGYGRFHYAENRNFCYYSRGSAFEPKTAIEKAWKSKLITEDEYNQLISKFSFYYKLINPYIKSLGTKS